MSELSPLEWAKEKMLSEEARLNYKHAIAIIEQALERNKKAVLEELAENFLAGPDGVTAAVAEDIGAWILAVADGHGVPLVEYHRRARELMKGTE